MTAGSSSRTELGSHDWAMANLGSPTHWPSVPPWDAAATWADLRGWVESLVDRFGLDARAVPPCWFRHNAHVEALSALRDYEWMSFHPTTPPGGAVDFLHALREVEYRLIEWSSRTQCSINEHRPDPARSWHTDNGDWEAFVSANTAGRQQFDIDSEDYADGVPAGR